MAFFTGGHDDYHRPNDKPDTLDYEGTQRIAVFARGIVAELQKPDRPAYAQVARRDAGAGSRETLRAYLGSIPDYGAEVQGVRLSGVRAGGPADTRWRSTHGNSPLTDAKRIAAWSHATST